MKKIGLLLTAIALYSCTNEDSDAPLPNPPVVNELENRLKDGSWNITQFIDSGKDETADFNGFAFIFNNDGTVSARANAQEFKGTWSITNSNSNDDSNNLSDLDFNLQFNLTNQLEELTDDWDILSQTATEVKLQSISGGNGGTDLLTFAKNG